MTKPVRLQLSRKKGFRLQEHSISVNGLPALSVARPGRWGNPHVALRTWFHGGYPSLGIEPFEAKNVAEADREGARVAVGLFREDVTVALERWGKNHNVRAELSALRGKNLACWCKPGAPCHADVLLELANGPICEEVR
jgi:hypothetical protein